MNKLEEQNDPFAHLPKNENENSGNSPVITGRASDVIPHDSALRSSNSAAKMSSLPASIFPNSSEALE